MRKFPSSKCQSDRRVTPFSVCPIPLRTASWVLAFFVFLACAQSSAAPKSTGASAKAGSKTRRTLLVKFRSRFRSLKPDVVFAYYRSAAPDLLDEFERHCRNRAEEKAEKTLNGMARHYLRLEQVRRRSMGEYARLVELDTLEYQARVAGKRIIQLGRLAARGEMTADRTAELEKTRKELARKLADSFAHAHDNQLVEITRLEVELKNMRDLLERRAGNRETILRRRYFKLCGEDAKGVPPFPAKDVSTQAEQE